MAKKKIAVIFPKDSEAVFNIHSRRTFGGATVQLFHLVREMSKNQEFDIYSLIPNYPVIDFPFEKDFQLIKTYQERECFLKRYFSFYKTLKNLRPEIIIQRGLTLFSCLLAVYCKIFKIKFVFMFAHDVEVKGIYQTSRKKCFLFKSLLKNSGLIVTQNTYQQNTLFERYKKETLLMPNGYPVLDAPQIEEKRGVLWVSRCDPWKKPEIFLDLAQKNPDLSFTMICPPASDKNYFNEIKRKAEEVKNLIFLDFVSFYEIDSCFHRAAVFVNTSENEGFPNTFLQAAAAGTPILSLNVDPDGFIERNGYGVVCNGEKENLGEQLKNPDFKSVKIVYKNFNFDTGVFFKNLREFIF